MHERNNWEVRTTVFAFLSSKPQLWKASAGAVVDVVVVVDVDVVVVGDVARQRFDENCNLIQIGWLGRHKLVVVVKLTLSSSSSFFADIRDLGSCGAWVLKPLTGIIW